MAAFTLLDSFPPLVRAFVRRAQAVGLECREGASELWPRHVTYSLRGTEAQFRELPEMASQRFSKVRTSTRLWLELGASGRVYRDGDMFIAEIHETRIPGQRARCVRECGELAKADTAFQTFMRKAMELSEPEAPGAAA